MTNFTPSTKCLNLLKSIETLALVPFLDSGGVATIAYGCTYYEDGTPVTLNDAPITSDRADELFNNIIIPFYQCVNNVITADMVQQQFDAFFIMCYNCGTTAFSRPAQVVKWFNLGNIPKVVSWWPKSFITANGGADIVEGLVNRRNCELDIFQNGIYQKW